MKKKKYKAEIKLLKRHYKDLKMANYSNLRDIQKLQVEADNELAYKSEYMRKVGELNRQLHQSKAKHKKATKIIAKLKQKLLPVFNELSNQIENLSKENIELKKELYTYKQTLNIQIPQNEE